MATNKRCAIDQDPDYEEVAIHQNKRQKTIEKDGKEATKKKIEAIIQGQFAQEIMNKEQEILKIDDRISHCRAVLDKMRSCIVARYYGCAGQTGGAMGLSLGRLSNQQPSIHPSVKRFLGKTTRSSGSITPLRSQVTKKNEAEAEGKVESFSRPATPLPVERNAKVDSNKSDVTEGKKSNTADSLDVKRSSRFKVKKRIIVGNVSKYIPLDKREDNDPATHKWMVYVRGPPDQPKISTFVKKVWFFLHPSYRPNDLVEMSQYPYQLTRRGWGEFPIRVQLHFKDTRNKRVDIIHLLKLDKTYTGLQTLGAETTVDIEIEREDMPAATVTKPLPQATSTPVLTQQEKAPNKRVISSSLCSNTIGRKSLDSSGNSIDSDAQNSGLPKRCGSEISDTSMESDSLGGVFGSNKQTTENGLKRTSSQSSNISSSSELFSLDRRKFSIDELSAASNSRVPSATTTSPSDVSVPSSSRGATPDYTSLKIKQEPVDETPPFVRTRKPKISLNLTEVPGGTRIKTEPVDLEDVSSTVTTPDSGIGIRPEPMDLGVDGASSTKEIPEALTDGPSSVPSFDSSSNESLSASNVPQAPPVASNNTNLQSMGNVVSSTTALSAGVDNKGVTSPGGKVGGSQSSGSAGQNLYIKCVDPQGNLCLIPQHLLMKAPQGTSIGKPVVSPLPVAAKTGTGQNVVKSPAGAIQMLLPTPGITAPVAKPRSSVPMLRPTDPSLSGQAKNVGSSAVQLGNLVLRTTSPGVSPGTQKGPAPKLQPAVTRLFLDPIPSGKVGSKPEQTPVSSRLKPPGSVSLLNRLPSLATSAKTSVAPPPGLITMGTSTVRQPLPGKPGKGASVPPLLTLKNLSPNPPTSVNINSVPAESSSGPLGQNPNVLTITSQSSPIPSATGPPPTAQLVKANIGGKLVWLQLFPNHKPGANKVAKALTGGAAIKTETGMKSVSGVAGKNSVVKTNPDGNITITMGTGNYQAASQNVQKPPSLLKPGSQNYTMKNNSIFHQESGISNMKTLPKEQWVKYRQKRVDEVKQAEKPVNPDLYNDFASLLKAVIRQYPIVHPNPDRSIHPYCARNLQHFRGWNIGKRRAAEWQRASDVQTRLQTLLKDGSTFKGEKIWSTKRIMIWCRHHLYTPPDPTHNSGEPHQVEAPSKVDSFSDMGPVVANIQPLEHALDDDSDSDVEIVDVVGMDIGSPCIKKEKKSPVKEEEKVKFYMPVTSEAEYIRDVAGKVGVQLKSVEVEPDVFAPLAEGVIFTAMKEFTENILRNAARIKIQNQGTGDEVTAIDIYKSIKDLNQCDFLTNAGLGREIEQKASPSKPS